MDDSPHAAKVRAAPTTRTTDRVREPSDTREERDDSVWHRRVLKLVKVCWMDPKAYIENVPAHWKKVTIAIYHGFLEEYELSDISVVVKVASMTNPNDFSVLSTTPLVRFKTEDSPVDTIHRQELLTTQIDDAILAQGPYCINVTVVSQGGNW